MTQALIAPLMPGAGPPPTRIPNRRLSGDIFPFPLGSFYNVVFKHISHKFLPI
jgi:hypothetical protein